MPDSLSQLKHLRARTRWYLILQRCTVLGAWVVGAALVLIGLDYLVRFPAAFRLVALLAGLGALGWYVMRSVVPAIAFHPSLTELALRVERSIPPLEGRLASSVEFATAGLASRNPLAARAVRETESRLATAPVDAVVRPGRTKRDLAIFGLMLVIAVGFVALTPASAATGVQRLLWPFGASQWPARTGVESLMVDTAVHPRGQALALRAQGTKAPGDSLDDMDIRAHYRLKENDSFARWREVILTPQGSARYERLIDTNAEAIEFYFASDDARTDRQVIDLVPPPAVARATLAVTPPAYAEQHIAATTIELGTGLDERAMTESPLLAGSQATMRLSLSKPIPVPDDPAARADWLAQTLGWSLDAPLPTLTTTGSTVDAVEITWQLTQTTPFAIDLVDAHGLHSVDDIAFRVDVVDDRSPTVTMTDPQSDEAVLASAVVPLEAEARDDVSIVGIGLEAHKEIRDAADRDETERVWRQWHDADIANALITDTLDLGRFGLEEGDVIQVSGIAADGYYLDGEEHPEVRSAVRRLRVISEREFGETMVRELRALRENAIRIEAQQGELQDDVIDDGVQPGVRTAQDRIGERLADQLESINRLRNRAAINRFSDGQLDVLIDQAEDLLRHAGTASNDASRAIGDRERQAGAENAQTSSDPTSPSEDPGNQAQDSGEPRDADDANADRQPRDDADQAGDPDATDAESREPSDSEPFELREPRDEDREIVEQQQEVRDELHDLIEALDRNEDSWVMNQRIKDLLDEQTQLQAETSALSEQTRGRSVSDLTQQELSELDRIAQRQRELAEQLRDLTDELRDRADDLAEVDPQAAEAQRAAADTAEEREIDRDMENAADQASDNQLQNAQNSQQRARSGLERMLEDVNQKRAQAEELHRRLQSLIESIKRLVTLQESEINELGRARFDDDYAGRDRAMIRLNQNTQAVAGEARQAGREAARIARALDRASDAQGAAIGYLRENPIAGDDADAAERRALELLREALELAEELEEQAEEEMMEERRDALLTAYRELAERQIGLRGATLELQQAGELGRRELVEARKQGNTQDDIRIALDAIRDETQEVSDSRIFTHVHDLIDGWAGQVTDSLREGDVGTDVTDRELAIAEGVGRLINALEEEQAEPNEFEEGSQSGGGGGGQGQSQPQPLVPPIAELKLLRGLQEHIYERTRDLDARGDLDDAARRQRLRELGREQADLQQLGQEMLEALSNENGPGGGDPPQPRQPDQPEGGSE